jgi:hypothetical protein
MQQTHTANDRALPGLQRTSIPERGVTVMQLPTLLVCHVRDVQADEVLL